VYVRHPNRWTYNVHSQQKLKEIKTELCHLIKRSARRRNYDQKTMAFYMGTTPSNASLVDNIRIEQLTINQLFRYLVNLEPNFRMLIAL